jgi:hypothetical protein
MENLIEVSGTEGVEEALGVSKGVFQRKRSFV